MSRRLRILKWTFGAGAAVLVCAFVGTSVWGPVWVEWRGGMMGMGDGFAAVGENTNIGPGLHHMGPTIFKPWKLDVKLSRPRTVLVPGWSPALVAGVAFAMVWRHERRSGLRNQPGHCRGCGYDLRGLSARLPCPECGAAQEAGGAA